MISVVGTEANFLVPAMQVEVGKGAMTCLQF